MWAQKLEPQLQSIAVTYKFNHGVRSPSISELRDSLFETFHVFLVLPCSRTELSCLRETRVHPIDSQDSLGIAI